MATELYEKYHAEILATLQKYARLHQAEAAKDAKKSDMEFLVVSVPEMRQVVKKGFSFYNKTASEVLSIWNELWWNTPYYEVMFVAAEYYALHPKDIGEATWKQLANWAYGTENWATSDQLSSIYAYVLPQYPVQVKQTLSAWNKQLENQWLRRISIVSLIRYTGKKAVYLPPEEVLPSVENCIEDGRYYVQKAVGWVLREMRQAYPDVIDDFLVRYATKLSADAFRRAISRHSNAEQKTLIRLRD